MTAAPFPTMYWPAEWHSQRAVLLAWPHVDTDWANMFEQVERVYVDLVVAISRFERVLILCADTQHMTQIQVKLSAHALDQQQLHFYPCRYNDTWVRDYGPITVIDDQQTRLLDFTFNGWGNKFDASLDNTINRQLQAAGAWRTQTLQSIDFVLEGGSMDTDGLGTILTTTACLLNPNRNTNNNRQQLEQILSTYLGSKRVLWLESGYLAGDDTDSHVDMLARFCNPYTIAYSHCDDPQDEHYPALKQMAHELQQFTNTEGKAYDLVPLTIPAAIHDQHAQRLPASYTNFLILNQAVLMPVYGDQAADAQALKQLQNVFSEREVIAIDCKPLIMQHGSLHCATMQLPETGSAAIKGNYCA